MAKDFLSVLDLSAGEVARLLDIARQMKADRRLGRQAPTAHALAGRHVAMLFEKPSLRTRSTFEIAVKELGAETLHVRRSSRTARASRSRRREKSRAMGHAVVVRTYAHEKVASMAAVAPRLHVINALSDEQHPCQALADMIRCRSTGVPARTAHRLRRRRQQRRDVARARHGAARVPLHVASPRGYELPAESWTRAPRRQGRRRAAVVREPCEAIRGVDAVYTDVWTSMGQEGETELRKQVFGAYQVDSRLMASAAPGRSSCTACRRTAAKK